MSSIKTIEKVRRPERIFYCFFFDRAFVHLLASRSSSEQNASFTGLETKAAPEGFESVYVL